MKLIHQSAFFQPKEQLIIINLDGIFSNQEFLYFSQRPPKHEKILDFKAALYNLSHQNNIILLLKKQKN